MAGASWLAGFFNQVIKTKSMPHDWSKSATIPIWKYKGDIANFSKYRQIRLMNQTIFERLLETRLPPSKSCHPTSEDFSVRAADAIHTVRIMMKKYREKRRELHAGFLDMEKAFDKVPHDVIW
ncbi:unnamed protein product [Strongylus vulgaris]|uniref:Reverse transcriptase domain-containing protein n=1 Tax=Strongylus vulgaris TaxID=40348 RepID=A0A3P7IEN6_STRVU|nr:unnamed protein product [Strongylus vulgaris]